MSRVFYSYKIKKEEFWETVIIIRNFIQKSHLAHEIIEGYIEKLATTSDTPIVLLKKIKENKKDIMKLIEELAGTNQLQVFDLDKNTFLVNSIEKGYIFYNSFLSERWAVEPCFYDGRSDVSPEMEKNYPIGEWICKQIEEHRYFLYPLVTTSDWNDWIFNKWKEYSLSK